MRILIILVILAIAYFVILRPRLASPPESEATPTPTPEASILKRPIDRAKQVVEDVKRQQRANDPTDNP